MINFTHLNSISNIYEFKSNQKQFKSNHYKFESKYKSNPTKVLLTACYTCRPRELTGSVGVTGTRKRKTEISTVWNQVVTIKYLDKNIRYYCTERKESYISVCWYIKRMRTLKPPWVLHCAPGQSSGTVLTPSNTSTHLGQDSGDVAEIPEIWCSN